MRHALLASMALLFASLAWAGYVPRAEVASASRMAATEAASYPDEAALAAALLQARTRSVVAPLSNEARLVALLTRLREVVAPMPATRAAVAGLQDFEPLTQTDPVDPEQRRRTAPAFSVSGMARSVLQQWDLRENVAQVRAALARGDVERLQSAAPAALAEVIAVASEDELATIRSSEPRDPRVRRVLFERLADPALALDLLQQPAQPEGLRLIAEIDTLLPAATAHAVLTDPNLDAGYLSAARLALGRMADRYEPARQHLLATLGDAEGASSATALASASDPETLQALGAIVRGDADGPRLRNALLALRLSDAPAAKVQLKAFAASPSRPAKLRDEVRAWLR